MDGFIQLVVKLILRSGIGEDSIFFKQKVELPGYFRPTKEWDLLVVHRGQLLVALEAKSQVGPSFGNNFNNRTEEAMGTALDLWTAYREGAFQGASKPLVAYLFLLEDCEKSNSPVRVKESHFKVFPEFVDASYSRRYEIFCRKLMLERHYDSVAYLVSDHVRGRSGGYQEPSEDLRFERFALDIHSHLSRHGEGGSL